MTNEEAIERFEWHKPYLADESWKECYQLAIEALEKKIPKKVYLTFGNYYCPHCNIGISRKNTQHFKYCSECGHRLDWSDEQ